MFFAGNASSHDRYAADDCKWSVLATLFPAPATVFPAAVLMALLRRPTSVNLLFLYQESLQGSVDDLTVEKVGCYWMSPLI